MDNRSMNEEVSALADGQLQGEAFARAVEALAARHELREQWQTYHLVGDVLRSGRHLPCSDPARFVARLAQRIAAEQVAPMVAGATVPREPALSRRPEAANQPVFRWKLVAGLASVAAAAAIGWNWLGNLGGTAASGGAQLAQQQPAGPAQPATPAPTVRVASEAAAATSPRPAAGIAAPQLMLRDPRLDELLQAHQQAGGAAQMPSGFLRNATFDGSSR